MSENGYNMTYGGNGRLGYKLSKETKEKISKNHHNVSGKLNPMFGRKHSPETIQKIINNRKTFKGENNPNYGKKHTEETKKLIGLASKRYWESQKVEGIKSPTVAVQL